MFRHAAIPPNLLADRVESGALPPKVHLILIQRSAPFTRVGNTSIRPQVPHALSSPDATHHGPAGQNGLSRLHAFEDARNHV
eukprot:15453839-Alexandrium_andersonii.AAC.1